VVPWRDQFKRSKKPRALVRPRHPVISGQAVGDDLGKCSPIVWLYGPWSRFFG